MMPSYHKARRSKRVLVSFTIMTVGAAALADMLGVINRGTIRGSLPGKLNFVRYRALLAKWYWLQDSMRLYVACQCNHEVTHTLEGPQRMIPPCRRSLPLSWHRVQRAWKADL